MTKTHQSTTHQVSIGDYLEGDAADSKVAEIAPKNIKPDVDPSTRVHIGAEKYHQDLHGISACPGIRQHLTPGTLVEAARKKRDPCKKCDPVDYRPDSEGPETVTLGGY